MQCKGKNTSESTPALDSSLAYRFKNTIVIHAATPPLLPEPKQLKDIFYETIFNPCMMRNDFSVVDEPEKKLDNAWEINNHFSWKKILSQWGLNMGKGMA